MIKKVILVLVSLAILACGFVAQDKLSYWERSVRIFKMDEQSFGRRDFGGRGESREAQFNGRPDFRNLPDSIRQRFEARARQQFPVRELPDSLSQRIGSEARGRSGNNSNPGIRGDIGHGRGDFRGGKNVNLARIPWFLSVFASFTVITFCLDRLYLLLRKRR